MACTGISRDTGGVILKAPNLIRKVILAGTSPAGGEGIEKVGPVSGPLIIKGILTFRDPTFYLFFTSTANGRGAAKAFMERLQERRTDRDKLIAMGAFLRQLKAIKAWGMQAQQDLGAIRQPVWWRMAITISWCRAATRSIWRGVCQMQNSSSMKTPGMEAFSSITKFVKKALAFLEA